MWYFIKSFYGVELLATSQTPNNEVQSFFLKEFSFPYYNHLGHLVVQDTGLPYHEEHLEIKKSEPKCDLTVKSLHTIYSTIVQIKKLENYQKFTVKFQNFVN